MGLLKYQADAIFNGYHILDGHWALITTDAGSIVDIVPASQAGSDVQKVEGMLCPGFVNAHCHLELSHMKGRIRPQAGMVNFLLQVVQQRADDPRTIEEAMEAAVQEMRTGGIVAVGDICNTADSIAVKKRSDLYFHNFVEATGFVPATAQKRWEAAVEVAGKFLGHFSPEQVSITPHAPYSVSPQLLQSIIDHYPNQTLTIHNQESEAENELFERNTGDMLRLYAQLGIHSEQFFKPYHTTSLQALWPIMKQHQRWLLVHNTETSAGDLHAIDVKGAGWKHVFFCLCFNANHYINYAVPSLHRFLRYFPLQICLGTDSYASNYRLSLLSEMMSMQQRGKYNKLYRMLQMATLNGAKALGIEHTYGSFEKGKRPGVLLLSGIDKGMLTRQTAVKRLC
jgi:cytosine/adenosine deaminase-related metal-dependent hydrolase